MDLEELIRSEGIPKSTRGEKIKFLGTAAVYPKVVSPFRLVRHPFSQENRDFLSLRSYQLDNSTTFGLALYPLKEDAPKVWRDLVTIHQAYKVLDFIDEKPDEILTGEQKTKLIDDFLESIRKYDSSNVKRINSELRDLGFNENDVEHKSLIRNLPVLLRYMHSRPEEIREAFLEFGNKMKEGFEKRREGGKLENFGDVDRHCLFDAGYVGYTINRVYRIRGIISEEEEEDLGTLARRVGKAMQLGNNVRDLFEDILAESWRWPSRLVDPIAEAMNIEDENQRNSKMKEIYGSGFKEIIDYTREKFFESADYIDELPRFPPGPAIFPALGLVMYAAVVNQADNPEFLISLGRSYRKPSKNEIFNVKDAITHLVKSNKSIRPLLEHYLG